MTPKELEEYKRRLALRDSRRAEVRREAGWDENMAGNGHFHAAGKASANNIGVKTGPKSKAPQGFQVVEELST